MKKTCVKMNTLDKQYTDLLQDILDNGVPKSDRTTTGTISVFGRQIRHKMSDGFPLLTTKKMAWKSVVTELLWFLRGDTNIKYLVDNDVHIWNGDAYKNYVKHNQFNSNPEWLKLIPLENGHNGADLYTQEEFINKIKTDDEFAKKWGELGPIYGNQWRKWKIDERRLKWSQLNEEQKSSISKEALENTHYDAPIFTKEIVIDQIQNLINDLKTNPDSRRLMVNAWNVGELDQMVLPPCHYGFQVYTRELSLEERCNLANFAPFDDRFPDGDGFKWDEYTINIAEDWLKQHHLNLPKRAISLMWNQRSVDTFLGLPFNIASYGLLLEIIAKAVNMIPDELIGNLGDVHLYSNHIEQAKEQIGRELTNDEWIDLMVKKHGMILEGGDDKLPTRTREPFPLPTININTEFWPYEGGECGVGPLDAVKVFESFKDDNFCKCLLEEDIQLSNYQSHPTIKAPLSN